MFSNLIVPQASVRNSPLFNMEAAMQQWTVRGMRGMPWGTA
jgi:hypothetical protein